MSVRGIRREREPRDVTGLVVAVTGGARGIGRCTADVFARAGARVVIGDRDADVAEATAAELGTGVRALPLDVSSTDSWRDFLAAVGEPIDVLVNNAGVMPLGPVLKEPEDVARLIFDINTHGPINGTKAVAPGMVGRGHGHVVTIASAVGRLPMAGGATYSASKHAVVGFTDAVRQELAPHGVDVSMVLPSVVRTELSAGIATGGSTPSVSPEEVAEVVLDVVRRPVPEVWVPRWAQPLSKVTGVLPRRVQEAVARVFDADDVLLDVDETARSAYEERARRR